MSRLQEQVVEFHRLFALPIAEIPTIPAPDRIRLRVALVSEEFFEMLEALYGALPEWPMCKEIIKNAIKNREPRVDLVDLADALGDIDYVVTGTRLEFGLDGDPIAEAIHKANMAKVGGEVRSDGKIMKPAQWAPPDKEIEQILMSQCEGRSALKGK